MTFEVRAANIKIDKREEFILQVEAKKEKGGEIKIHNFSLIFLRSGMCRNYFQEGDAYLRYKTIAISMPLIL